MTNPPQQATLWPRAREAADAAVPALMESLTPPSQQELKFSIEKRDQLRLRRDRLAAELRDIQSSLRKQADAVDVSPATIRQLLASLQTQRESLSLDLVANQARADALTEQIAKFSEQLAKKVDDDPVAKELQTVVEYQQKSMQRMQEQQKAGVVTNAEADKAVADLAEVRAKLLERKSVAAAAAGGDTLAAWNKELMTLAVDKAELNARLKEINGRLDRLTDAGDVLDHIEQMRGQLADLSKPLAEADAAVSDLQFHAARDHVEFKLLPDKSTNDPAPATQPAQ
jgi:chromosome segregation ATPase